MKNHAIIYKLYLHNICVITKTFIAQDTHLCLRVPARIHVIITYRLGEPLSETLRLPLLYRNIMNTIPLSNSV